MQISGTVASAKTQPVAYFNKKREMKQKRTNTGRSYRKPTSKTWPSVVHLGGLRERGFLLLAVEGPCLQEVKDPQGKVLSRKSTIVLKRMFHGSQYLAEILVSNL